MQLKYTWKQWTIWCEGLFFEEAGKDSGAGLCVVAPVPMGKNCGCEALFAVPVDCTGPIPQNKVDCDACPLKTQCIGSRGAKVAERSCFWKEVRQDLSELDSLAYPKVLRKRQIWSEGTFAAQKWGHNLARLLFFL